MNIVFHISEDGCQDGISDQFGAEFTFIYIELHFVIVSAAILRPSCAVFGLHIREKQLPLLLSNTSVAQ